MKSFTGFKKGVDFGGWLSQCGEGNYNDKHYSEFITADDFRRAASWGLDHVRVPVDYNVVQNEDGSLREEGFAFIDSAVSECEKNALNMVLDLHKALGYVFDDKGYCSLFTDTSLQDKFVLLWEELARRYGNKDNIAFELLNEITDPKTAEIWNDLAERTVKAIRVIAPTTRIIIGGIFNSSIYGLSLLRKPLDENIVYTFHCYSPLIFTHQGAYWVENMPADLRLDYPMSVGQCRAESKKVLGMDYDVEFADLPQDSTLGAAYFDKMFGDALAVSEKYDVPLYCGEYGVIDLAPAESTLRWYADIHAAFEKYDIPRAAWNYKEKDFGLIGEHYAPILSELVKLL